MSWTMFFLRSAAILTLVCAHGCSTPPASFVDGVEYVAHQGHIHDAHATHVKHHPELRVNDALVERLEHAASTSAHLDEARQTALTFIDEAHALSIAVTRDEIDMLDEDGLAELNRLYFEDTPKSKAQIFEIFAAETDYSAALLRERVQQANTTDELDAVLQPLRDDLETPVRAQGRFGRMAPWLLFTIPSQIAIDDIYDEEERGNCDVAFDSATVYAPVDGESPDVRFGELLTRFAPIIVQESTPADATYADSVDRIGTVEAVDDDTIEVWTGRASVYGYARELCIAGTPHVQLIYTHWYPEHPELEPNDPEAGHIEGVTLRITLDAEQRPLLFETLYNCGCSPVPERAA